MYLKFYFQQSNSHRKKKPQHCTCRELRVSPSPFGGIGILLQIFRGHITTLTSVVHTADAYRETHHNDDRRL